MMNRGEIDTARVRSAPPPAVASVAEAPPGSSRTFRLAAWSLSGLAGAAGALALRAWPALAQGPPICAFRQLTHLGCPTCGLTRALASLARGDLAGSIALHPLALPVALQAIVIWALWGAGVVGERSILRQRAIAWIAGANALAFLATWIVRLTLGILPT
jgi:hypothetical protein